MRIHPSQGGQIANKILLTLGGTPFLAEENIGTPHVLVHKAGHMNQLCLGQATTKLWTEETSTTSRSQGLSLACPLHCMGRPRLETRMLLQTTWSSGKK